MNRLYLPYSCGLKVKPVYVFLFDSTGRFLQCHQGAHQSDRSSTMFIHAINRTAVAHCNLWSVECAECCGDSPCPAVSHLHLYSTTDCSGSNRFLSRQAEYCATYDSFKHLHLVVGLARDLEEFDRDCRACEHPLHSSCAGTSDKSARGLLNAAYAPSSTSLSGLFDVRSSCALRARMAVLLLIDASLLDEARRCYGAAEQLEAHVAAWR